MVTFGNTTSPGPPDGQRRGDSGTHGSLREDASSKLTIERDKRLHELAIPQQLGPNGSRVTKARSSVPFPRLGNLNKVKTFWESGPSAKRPETLGGITLGHGIASALKTPTPEANTSSDGDGLIGRNHAVFWDTATSHDYSHSSAASISSHATHSSRHRYATPDSSPPTPCKESVRECFSGSEARLSPPHYNHSRASQECMEPTATSRRSNQEAAFALCQKAAQEYNEMLTSKAPHSHATTVHSSPTRHRQFAEGDFFHEPLVAPPAQRFNMNGDVPEPSTHGLLATTQSSMLPVSEMKTLSQPTANSDKTKLRASSNGFSASGLYTPLDHARRTKKRLLLTQKLKMLPKSEDCNVHIFVDMSNIFIGYQNVMGTKRRSNAPFSFEQFALILERNRPISKRILVGSVKNAKQRQNPATYFQEAKNLDYAVNLFVRVPQPFEPKVRSATHQHWVTTSEEDSCEDHTVNSDYVRLGEQGVDENLHLHMSQSMLNSYQSPGLMVLATGDAKAAQFSAGFASFVTDALSRGWHVELVSWRKSMSWQWRQSPFCDKYANQFRIIELDQFFDDLAAYPS